jgi:hypothetical protein
MYNFKPKADPIRLKHTKMVDAFLRNGHCRAAARSGAMALRTDFAFLTAEIADDDDTAGY